MPRIVHIIVWRSNIQSFYFIDAYVCENLKVEGRTDIDFKSSKFAFSVKHEVERKRIAKSCCKQKADFANVWVLLEMIY